MVELVSQGQILCVIRTDIGNVGDGRSRTDNVLIVFTQVLSIASIHGAAELELDAVFIIGAAHKWDLQIHACVVVGIIHPSPDALVFRRVGVTCGDVTQAGLIRGERFAQVGLVLVGVTVGSLPIDLHVAVFGKFVFTRELKSLQPTLGVAKRFTDDHGVTVGKLLADRNVIAGCPQGVIFSQGKDGLILSCNIGKPGHGNGVTPPVQRGAEQSPSTQCLLTAAIVFTVKIANLPGSNLGTPSHPFLHGVFLGICDTTDETEVRPKKIFDPDTTDRADGEILRRGLGCHPHRASRENLRSQEAIGGKLGIVNVSLCARWGDVAGRAIRRVKRQFSRPQRLQLFRNRAFTTGAEEAGAAAFVAQKIRPAGGVGIMRTGIREIEEGFGRQALRDHIQISPCGFTGHPRHIRF